MHMEGKKCRVLFKSIRHDNKESVANRHWVARLAQKRARGANSDRINSQFFDGNDWPNPKCH